jgi:hypothetical protein
MPLKEEIVKNYVEAYSNFDVDNMIANFDENVVFKNVLNNETNMLLTGIAAFKQQAEQAKAYFKTREQRIKSIKHSGHAVEIEIDYHAVLAIDLPNGLKAGEVLNLSGKSVFLFEGDKVIKLTDIS